MRVLIAQLSNEYPRARRLAQKAANTNLTAIVANIEGKCIYRKLWVS